MFGNNDQFAGVHDALPCLDQVAPVIVAQCREARGMANSSVCNAEQCENYRKGKQWQCTPEATAWPHTPGHVTLGSTQRVTCCGGV